MTLIASNSSVCVWNMRYMLDCWVDCHWHKTVFVKTPWVCFHLGLSPSDSFDEAIADMISDGVEDVVANIIEAFMEKDEDKKVSFWVMKNVRELYVISFVWRFVCSTVYSFTHSIYPLNIHSMHSIRLQKGRFRCSFFLLCNRWSCRKIFLKTFFLPNSAILSLFWKKEMKAKAFSWETR